MEDFLGIVLNVRSINIAELVLDFNRWMRMNGGRRGRHRAGICAMGNRVRQTNIRAEPAPGTPR